MQRGQEGDAWSQQLPGICVNSIQDIIVRPTPWPQQGWVAKKQGKSW